MMNLRDNKGVTLVELLVTIAIGSLITLAATTILLLGLRIHKQSTQTATIQNQVRVGITVIEELVKENPASEVGNILTYEDGVLRYASTDGVIMENISEYEFQVEGQLVTINLTVDEEEYEVKIYCREVAAAEATIAEGGLEADSVSNTFSSENVLTSAVSNRELTPQVRFFLKTLASQMGSTGRILTEEGQGEYFSEWYIGGYENNPGWDEETPWCACFVSWALEESSGYQKGIIPRFANVDSFWVEFVTTDKWKTENPEPGDVIFFDWILDTEKNAQHVGVVLAVESGWIYTIEGNSNGRVAVCRYAENDARIMGYGIPDWT